VVLLLKLVRGNILMAEREGETSNSTIEHSSLSDTLGPETLNNLFDTLADSERQLKHLAKAKQSELEGPSL
jgi:hypothetical protein